MASKGSVARTTAVLLAGLALLAGGLWTTRSPDRPTANAPIPTEAPATAPGSPSTPAAVASTDLRPRSDATVVATTDPTSADASVAATRLVPTDPPPRPPTDRTLARPTAAAPAAALRLGMPAQGGRLGAIFALAGLRTGEHEGYTRVVWELTTADGAQNPSAPLWEAVEQTNDREPKAAGILEGSCHIRLRLADTYAMDFVGPLSIDAAAGGTVNGVRILPMQDDSSLTFAIDLEEPAPYTVTVLQEPLRIVVDVYRP